MASSRFVVLPASLCLAWGLAFAVAAPAHAEAKSASKTKAGKVDINSASEAELEALPGVGAATAEKIIAGRPYASVADLEKAGVSAKTVEQIKPLVTARKPKAAASTKTKAEKPEKTAKAEKPERPEQAHTKTAKVNLNTATEQELEDLPGVGPATAQKIVAGRPYSSVADLSKAGVTTKTIEEIKPLVTAAKPKTPAVAKTEKAPTTAPHEEKTKPTKAEAKSSAKAEAEDDTTPARTPPRAGLVWVNTESKIFHREGDHWYGRTKKGEWMTEAEALKAGYRPVKEPEKKENP
jgi:DNA uptake protein ComE-like DNA-binding protein